MNTYSIARERYGELGVDTEVAIKWLSTIPISIHCWQGDDLRGFEGGNELGGGLVSTGNYPGRAETADELRANMKKAFALITGEVKANIHAIHGDVKGVERNAIEPRHYENWLNWAKIGRASCRERV